MEINKKSGSKISLETAIEYTHGYQQQHPEQPNSYFIGLDNLTELLNQNGCIGLRIYPGLQTSINQTNLVLVAVDTNQEDLTSGVIYEELVTCPPMCKGSQLVKK